MPYLSLSALAPKINRLLQRLQGMTLISAEIVENGFAFIYENDQERLLLRLLPTVYTQGKNIVDPINDMTLLLEVYRFTLQGDSPGELLGSQEIAFSAWLGEDFL